MTMTGKEAVKRLKKQYARQNDFIKENYDRTTVTLPKGAKNWIRENTGKSVNQFFNDYYREYRENTKEPE